jgi:hypothetical protein
MARSKMAVFLCSRTLERLSTRPVVPKLFHLLYHQLNLPTRAFYQSAYGLMSLHKYTVWIGQVPPRVLVPLVGNHWTRWPFWFCDNANIMH